MDPITIMAAVSAAFNGIKKAVELGREAQDIFGQLGKWAEGAGQLSAYINTNKNKKPSIFSSLKFGKSATSEAMDLIAAEAKLKEMEKEIRDLFYYGPLQEMGADGYRKFVLMRRQIREDRERMLRDQIDRRKSFAINSVYIILIFCAMGVMVYLSTLVYHMGVAAGKW
jgi:hypothetical protein